MTNPTTAPAPAASPGSPAPAPTFTLQSRELSGQLTAPQFASSMGGENQSPQLFWEHAPAGTQSFAVTIHDPDAPTGSGFWHWVLFNLPATVGELPAGAGDPSKNLTPAGAIQAHNDQGLPGYTGAAPTPGPAHRYVITVFAVSKKLPLDATATAAAVGFALSAATLARASLIAYGQQP